MAERASKRPRRLSSDDSDSEGNDDWMLDHLKKGSYTAARTERAKPSNMPRPRRGLAVPATAAPASNAPEAAKRSIRLNVKAPPSRLRQVMNEDDEVMTSRESLSRSSKNKKPIVDVSSDGEEDEDEEAEDDEDVGMENDAEDESEEEAGDDDDEDMSDAPKYPPPKIKISAPSGAMRKPSPDRVLKHRPGRIKSVEEKEMEPSSHGSLTGSDDELDSQEVSEEEDDEGEEGDEIEGDEDGGEEEEGDEEDEEEDEEEDDEGEDEEDDEEAADGGQDTIAVSAVGDEELDSSGDEGNNDLSSTFSGAGRGSRSETPDLSKLTRRQRAQIDAMEAESSLMALSNEAQKKKFFTEEQITMRRVEMARRRKDLSEKRNREEKEDTLKRLLHKPAAKRRSRAQMIADAEREEFGTPGRGDEREERIWRPRKVYVRTVMRPEGTRVGVPAEWLGGPAGRVFEGAKKSGATLRPGRMVEVVE